MDAWVWIVAMRSRKLMQVEGAATACLVVLHGKKCDNPHNM